jgi:hypothetical protein
MIHTTRAHQNTQVMRLVSFPGFRAIGLVAFFSDAAHG